MDERIQMFAAVVEHASINQASKVLNISQPALSRKIKKLEEILGTPLFNRTGKKMELTAAGQKTYDYAIELRQLQRKFRQSLVQLTSADRRTIVIGASLTTLQSTLPDLISFIIQHDPLIDIKTFTGKTHEVVTLVKNKKVDIGIVASSVQEPGITCVPLFDDHLRLVIPANHPISRQTPLTIDILHGLPMIMFSKGTWYRILMDELFHRYRLVPEIKMDIDSFEAILRLIGICGAAALLPESYLRPQLLRDNDLIALDIKELQEAVRTTSFVYRNNDDLALWVENRSDAIRSYFTAKHR